MALRLVVVTPVGAVVDADVQSVVGPGAEGEFGVLPEHEAFLAPLRAGVLDYRDASGQAHRWTLDGGFAEVTGERVTVLATSAAAA
jgi:F-type H+-transporting ATPase subunit epsilon